MTISTKIPADCGGKYLYALFYGNNRVQGPVITMFEHSWEVGKYKRFSHRGNKCNF